FLALAFLVGALSAAFFAGAFAGAFDVVAFAVAAVGGALSTAPVVPEAVVAVAFEAVAAPGSLATDDVGFDSADDPGRCGAGSGVDCCCRMYRRSAWTEAPRSTTTPTRRNSRRLTARAANPRRRLSSGPR